MITILKNPIDPQMEIWRDDDTGLYNATKTLKQFQTMYPDAPQRLMTNWTRLDQTKGLIKAVKDRLNQQYSIKIIKKGPNNLRGTYLHPILHIQFMTWLNSDYSIAIAGLLHELNEAQGDVVIRRIGAKAPPTCIICDANDALKAYDGHCRRCWEHSFPEEVQVGHFHSKEKSFTLPLKELYADNDDIQVVLDKTINGGCSRRRPDAFIDVLSHVIIVEIDEHQHKQYDQTCEERRIMELSEDVAHRPVVFIRLNPDEYYHDGEFVQSAFHISKRGIAIKRIAEYTKRWDLLEAAVNEHIHEQPSKTITIVKICFD